MTTQKTIYLWCLLWSVCLPTLSVWGQQMPNWHSFYEVGFTHNPALTARWSRAETSITHRREHSSFPGAPTTTQLSYQHPFIKPFTKTAIGAYLSHDELGPTMTYSGQFAYNYRIQPNFRGNRHDMLSFGMAAGARVLRFDPSREVAFDGLTRDPRLATTQSSLNPEISVGVFYSSTSDLYEFDSHYFGGIAMHRFLPVKDNLGVFDQLNAALQIMAHGGYRYVPFRSEYYIEPQLFLTYGWYKTFHAMAACRLEKRNSFWFTAGLSSNTAAFGQVGMVFDSQSFMRSLVRDGALRVGIKAEKQVFFFGKYTQIGTELYAAYTFDMDLYK